MPPSPSPTRNLIVFHPPYVPFVVEDSDHWKLTKLPTGYELLCKQGPYAKQKLTFTQMEAFLFEVALTQSWITDPLISINQRLTKIWNRFHKRAAPPAP
jgi:hypothetical protein